MEKYKANKNNNEQEIEDEVPVKSKEEINSENNANTIKNAAEVAMASKNPYAMAAGAAVKGLDKMTGGKSTELFGKATTQALKNSPGGKHIQNLSNQLSESGTGDKIGKAASTYNSIKGNNGNMVSDNKSSNNNSNKTSNSSFFKNNSLNSVFSSNSGSITDNIMSMFSFKKSLKIKIIIGVALIFVFIMCLVTIVSGKDGANIKLISGTTGFSNQTSPGGSTSVSSETLLAKLEEVGKWYIENVNTYQSSTTGKATGKRKYYSTPFGIRKFGDDCTEFVSAYVSYILGTDVVESNSADMVKSDGNWAKDVTQHGWKVYSTDEIDTLLPGDILVSNPIISYSRGNHAEVYISENESFGWGSIKSKYPTAKSITAKTKSGHKIFSDSGHDYVTVYRYENVNNNEQNSTNENNSNTNNGSNNNVEINIIKLMDASFNHGTKPKGNQKYIMLHDTEMQQDAKTVINSWKNAGSGTAAHFVIDRDGTVYQAVELDNIAHHAGWGGPGDFDSKFGVGNNDGNGNGDDLKGQKTTGWESYTSYGMNSYSIGIEMCHVGGENYPDAQLNALDSVISYIDNHFGFESTIIDHKAWRPSNSDTDQNFASYLSNYKNLRHH